jgi:hypothetical protein
MKEKSYREINCYEVKKNFEIKIYPVNLTCLFQAIKK